MFQAIEQGHDFVRQALDLGQFGFGLLQPAAFLQRNQGLDPGVEFGVLFLHILHFVEMTVLFHATGIKPFTQIALPGRSQLRFGQGLLAVQIAAQSRNNDGALRFLEPQYANTQRDLWIAGIGNAGLIAVALGLA